MEGRSKKIVGVILLYWITSISIVFLNKHLLSGRFGKHDLSIFVAWFQCLVSVVVLFIAKSVTRYVSIPSIDLGILLNSDVLLLSINFVASLTLNNLMLKHVAVAFYQVARSFTLIFTIILSVFMLKKGIKCLTLFSCFLVICGFFVSVEEEEQSGTLSIWGIIYGILSSLSAAFCAIYFRKVDEVMNGSPIKIAYYNNVNSFFIFLPLVVSTNQLAYVFSSDIIYDYFFWLYLFLSGLMSLTIGWASALQIQYTSPVTHHISINAKSVAQTLLAIMYYREVKTFWWWVGNMLVMLGIMSYAFFKMKEEKSIPKSFTKKPLEKAAIF
ncbi:hypothetical protein SNE40_015544 [Patella caerulea]|uniref:Sugar phosphate transporter domain-containing protein n=1 Tax=Patella caerulea TaxID=87958 RepID=A0AAN8PS69_PATCE